MSGTGGGGKGAGRSELARRLMVAGIGIPLGILAIRVGSVPLAVVIGAIAVLCTREAYDLAAARGARPHRALGSVAVALLILVVTVFPTYGSLAAWGWALTLALVLVSLALAIRVPGPGGPALASVGVTVLGFLYGGMMAFALLLHALPQGGGGDTIGGGSLGAWEGPLLLLFPLVVTWMGDSAAYFGGRRWGRRKLIPSVSPGKTVEGSLSGLVATVLSSFLFALLALGKIPGLGISPLEGAVIGLLLGVAAQIGDLAESVLKREAGVKDSGSFLPGHGGALDRFDAILFTLPLTWLLLEVARWLP